MQDHGIIIVIIVVVPISIIIITMNMNAQKVVKYDDLFFLISKTLF